MFPTEAIGPLITSVVWIVIFSVRLARGGGIYVAESIAIIGCVVTLQLLLDLHTRFLGDIAIVAVHLAYVAAVRLRCRGDRRRDHEQL